MFKQLCPLQAQPVADAASRHPALSACLPDCCKPSKIRLMYSLKYAQGNGCYTAASATCKYRPGHGVGWAAPHLSPYNC